MNTRTDRRTALAKAIGFCRRQPNPLDAANTVLLRRAPYWRAQREICAALADPSVTTVAAPSGHSVGKSYAAAGILTSWLALHRHSLVVATAPGATSLRFVLFKEVRRAVAGSPLRHYARVTSNPERLSFGAGNYAIGISTTEPERLSGHHAPGGPLLVVVDEASGIEDPEIWATLKSLKPTKVLLIGNPLRPDCPFHSACVRAETDPAVRLIRIPSTDSPDIHLERSPRGLADAAWLREMAAEYGTTGLVWKARVLAQFPEDAFDVVIPRGWLDRAERAEHRREGPTRIGLDLAEGRGGDRTVIVVRDDNGVICLEWSRDWSLEVAATRAALLAQRWGVAPHRVTFDASGIGADFANRLASVGLKGCQPYRGGLGGGKSYANLRTASAWQLRRRLDPERRLGGDAPGWSYLSGRIAPTGAGPVAYPQTPFAIPREAMGVLRPELAGLRYSLMDNGVIALEPAEDFAARLRHSPDAQSALCISFAFPEI